MHGVPVRHLVAIDNCSLFMGPNYGPAMRMQCGYITLADVVDYLQVAIPSLTAMLRTWPSWNHTAWR
jgi:hypothetical protein